MWDLCFAYIPLHTFLCDASETKREAVRFPRFTFSCWLYSAGRMGWDAGFSWQCVWHNFTLFIADSEGCCNRHILLACLLRQVVNAELPLWGNHNLILRFSSERIMLPGMFPCDPAAESAEFPVSLTRCLVPGRQPPSQALSTLSTSAGPISTKGFTELLSMYCTAQAARTLPHFADEKMNKYSLSTWPWGQLLFLYSLLSLLEQSLHSCLSSSPSHPGTALQLVIMSSVAKQ